MTQESTEGSPSAVRLTDEQQRRLSELIEKLELLPLAERIAESVRLRCPLPLEESGIKRMQRAMAGAFAAERIMYYLQSLRVVDSERDSLNRSISTAVQQERSFTQQANVQGAAESRVRSIYLSGLLEVKLHTFAVYAWRIAVLLPIAARAAGVKVDGTDMAILNSYEPLRHHYEHLEQRLPGAKKAAEYIEETRDDHVWRVVAGFEVDELGRFIIDETIVDVTTRGLAEIERVIQVAYESFSFQAVQEVRGHFEQHPDEIPDPDEIQQILLFSTWTPDLLPNQ